MLDEKNVGHLLLSFFEGLMLCVETCFYSGFPMVILLVLVCLVTALTRTRSISTVLMAAGWQYPALQALIAFPSGLEACL